MFFESGRNAARGLTLLSTVLLVLLACTPRGQMAIAPASAALGSIQTVFVGSTRKVDAGTGRFGSGRSETTHFASFGIAIPPEHTPGKIGWTGRNGVPDPRRDFLTVSQKVYSDTRAFRKDLSKEVLAGQQGVREVTLFVHGYNTTFDEGLYRFAQLAHDLELPGAAVHYAWPSAGTAMGYLQDKDSVLFARRGLEALIREVEAAGADRIYLVAHSVGASLAMETLRSLALENDASTLRHIGGVVLISPDIDVDVFRSQAQEIGTLPQPFVIFGSARDKALALSARLTGQRSRLGSLSDPAKVADLKVTILDVAAFNTGTGHFNVANSPALIRILDQLDQLDSTLDTDRRLRIGFVPGIVMTIQNATVVVLSPIASIGEQIVR